MTKRSSLVLIVLAAAAVAPAQVVLKLNLTPGKVYRTESVTSMTMDMGQGSNAMTTTQTVGLKVVSKTAKGFKIKSTIEAVKVGGKGPMAQGGKEMEKSLKGKSFDADVDFRGRSSNLDSTGMGGPMSGMSNFSSNITGAELPAGPVKVGSTWSSALDLAKMMGTRAQGMKVGGGPIITKYTVKSISNVGGKTLVNVAISMSGKPTMSMAGGAQGQGMSFSMSITGSGSASIDAGTGLVTTSSMKMNSTTAVGGMNMKQVITTSSKLKS